MNIGDTYFGSMQGYGQKPGQGSGIQNASDGYFASSNQKPPMANPKIKSKWLQPKQLMLMPARLAMALQDDGWILRNDIIWNKPNPMPSSVKDRLNTTYEHIYHFVKSKKYYYDLDAIREEHKGGPGQIRKSSPKMFGGDGLPEWQGQANREGRIVRVNPLGKNPGDVVKWESSKTWKELREKKGYKDSSARTQEFWNMYGGQTHPLGKNPGDLWSITTQPFPEAHFAVFPPAILIKPLKSSCPDNGLVLDPFMGSGTAAVVCKYPGKYGIKKKLNYIGFELNKKYVEIANKRLEQYVLV